MKKYLLIKQHILTNIEGGVWPAYTPVPSENQLAQEFGVSRMTARRALQELAEQGVIVRNQGAVSSVANMKSQSSMMAIRNIADEIKERGHEHFSRCIQLHSIEASDEVSSHLGLASGSFVYRSLVVHFENDVPIQIEERFVNPLAAGKYLDQDFNRQTTHHYLTSIAPLTEAEHWIEAVPANEEQAQLLAIKTGSPCLKLNRRTWSKKRSVSYAVLLHPGDRYRLGGHMTMSST